MNILLKPTTHLLQLNNENWLMNDRKYSNVNDHSYIINNDQYATFKLCN